MLDLREVTLTMIETLEHELGRLAVEECVNKAKFGQVLIFTDQPEKFEPLDCDVTFITVPNWPTKLEWSKFSWNGVQRYIRTAQTMHIQWDSWIWIPQLWRDEFMEYDLIGAPWWYDDGRNVGNLGFSLRSARIMKFLYKHRDRFPIVNALDDDLICRKYRVQLEESGFVWAPEWIAKDFAFECTRPTPTSKHFGFHAAFNFGQVLGPEALLNRARLLSASPYIKRTGYIWKSFCEKNPEVIKELEQSETMKEAAE